MGEEYRKRSVSLIHVMVLHFGITAVFQISYSELFVAVVWCIWTYKKMDLNEIKDIIKAFAVISKTATWSTLIKQLYSATYLSTYLYCAWFPVAFSDPNMLISRTQVQVFLTGRRNNSSGPGWTEKSWELGTKVLFKKYIYAKGMEVADITYTQHFFFLITCCIIILTLFFSIWFLLHFFKRNNEW